MSPELQSWFPLYREWLQDLFAPCTPAIPLSGDPADILPSFSMTRDHADYYPVGFGISESGPEITINTKLSILLSDPAAAEILIEEMPELKTISLQDAWADIPLNALLLAVGEGWSPFSTPSTSRILERLKHLSH